MMMSVEMQHRSVSQVRNWRSGIYPLLSRAERIIYPSRDVYQRFSRLYGNEK